VGSRPRDLAKDPTLPARLDHLRWRFDRSYRHLLISGRPLGRRETDDILVRLTAEGSPRLVLLHGPGGEGKSGRPPAWRLSPREGSESWSSTRSMRYAGPPRTRPTPGTAANAPSPRRCDSLSSAWWSYAALSMSPTILGSRLGSSKPRRSRSGSGRSTIRRSMPSSYHAG
jgi:hypothetical protein